MWIASFLFSLSFGTAPGVEDRVRAVVQSALASSHTPGASVAVVRNGRIVLAKGYGIANVEWHTAATPETRYGILSVSKNFTAAAVMLLERDGKLELSEPVGRYLPDTPEAWHAVTIRNLLTHTSGIPDYTDFHPFFEEIGVPRTPDELLAPVKKAPLLFNPGERFRYSNSNYYLLGQIIERLSGRPWEQFLKDRLFKPAGMTSTVANDTTDIVPQRSGGYHWLDDQAARLPAFVTGYHGRTNLLQNAIYIQPSKMWAAGSLLSTVMDLAKWQITLDSGSVLPREVIAQMEKPARLTDGSEAPYGFGNELGTIGGHSYAGHQGGGMAFNATVLRFPADKLSVIVLANQTSAPSRAVALRIAQIYMPDLVPKALAKDPDPRRTSRLKKLLLDAADGKPDPTMFAPEAAGILQFIRSSAPGFLKPLGVLQKFEFVSASKTPKGSDVTYIATFEKKKILWRFTLDEQGRVVQLEPTEQ